MHASLSRSIKSLFFLALFLNACGESEAPKKPKKPLVNPDSTVVPSPKPPLFNGPPDTSKASHLEICGSLLKQRNGTNVSIDDEGLATVEIDSEILFTNESLVTWGLETARVVFSEENCLIQKIFFSAKTKDGLVYQGTLKKQDFELYQERKISSAELSRRFEIRQMATLPYIKISLKRARTTNDLKQAESWLEQWLEKEPGSVPARIVKGNLALEKNQFADAVAFYDDVLRTSPDNIYALYNRAFAKRQTSRFGDAASDVEHILRLEHKGFSVPETTLRLMLADCYLADNKLKEALLNLEMVSNKSELDYLLIKANILRADKKFDEAIAILDVAKNYSLVDTVLFNRILLDLDKRDAIAARVRMGQLQDLNPKMANELDFLAPFHEPAPDLGKDDNSKKSLSPLVPNDQDLTKPANNDMPEDDSDEN